MTFRLKSNPWFAGYQLVPTAKKWADEEADKACKYEFGEEYFLATLSTATELENMQALCKRTVADGPVSGCWVGLSEVGDNVWSWSTDNVADQTSTYVMDPNTGKVEKGQGAWCKDCPDNYQHIINGEKHTEDCGMLWRGREFALNDGACIFPLYPICETFRGTASVYLCNEGLCGPNSAEFRTGMYTRKNKYVYEATDGSDYMIRWYWGASTTYKDGRMVASGKWVHGKFEGGRYPQTRITCTEWNLNHCGSEKWVQNEVVPAWSISTDGTSAGFQGDDEPTNVSGNNNGFSVYGIVGLSFGLLIVIVIIVGVFAYYRARNNRLKQMNEVVQDEEQLDEEQDENNEEFATTIIAE